MIKTQILEAIKQMPNSDRLEVIEFALKILRQDIIICKYFESLLSV